MLEFVATMPSRPLRAGLLVTLDMSHSPNLVLVTVAEAAMARGKCNFTFIPQKAPYIPDSYAMPWGASRSPNPQRKARLCNQFAAHGIVMVGDVTEERLVSAHSPFRRNPNEALFLDLPRYVLSLLHGGFGGRGHVALQRST